MAERLRHLQALTATLGDAVTVDDVTRASLNALRQVPEVVRAGLALTQGAGRELRFVSSDEGALSPLGVRWCSIDGLADVPLADTVRSARPVFARTLEDLARDYPQIHERQRSLGARALASLPLTAGEECLGGLLISFAEEQTFDLQQQAFLSAFAAQITQALRRGLAYQIQQSTSERLQRSLMPHALPDLEGLALGGHYQPGGANVDVGGDWYDVLPFPDGSVAITLGDVMGKGVPAAIVMSEVRAATRAYALLDPTPSVVVSRLDHLVTRLAAPDQIVTLLYGLMDAERRTVRLVIAGHPPPLLVPRVGRASVLDARTGPALGLGAGPWPEVPVDLEEHTSLLFYSDGLVETREVDLFTGVERLRDQIDLMGPRRRNPREMCARLADLMWGEDADDDVTLLGIAPATTQRSAGCELPADPSAAGAARRFLTDHLLEWGVDEDITDTARLCVSELVTNAVIHSGTAPRLTVRTDSECLLVIVQDQGGHGAVRQAVDQDPESISGRGLSLIDALATAWSAEHSPDGTTVWFELELTPAQVLEMASAGSGAAE